MLKFQTKTTLDKLFLVSVALVFVYVNCRAFALGITDDEAWSFFNAKQFWYVEALCTGNTHWFNFAAIKMAIWLGLEKTYQIRWLSVLSGLVYLSVAFYWLQTFKHNLTKSLVFGMLVLNAYLLEYFGLARGYASAIALMSLSLLFVYRALQNPENDKLWMWSLFFSGASAIANFNFFYFFASYALVYAFLNYGSKGWHMFVKRRFVVEFVYCLIIVYLVLRALWFVKQCSNDIGGFGGDSLIESVFGSLCYNYFYPIASLSEITTTVLSYILFVCVLITIVFGIINYKKHQNSFYYFSSLVLVLMIIMQVFNYHIFHVLYPIQRTTLMYFPLISIQFICFFDVYLVKFLNQKSGVLIIVLFGLNFIMSVNVTHVRDYEQQADADKAYSFLNLKGVKNIGVCPELYFVYLKYYSMIYPNLKGEMIKTIYPFPDILKASDANLKTYDYLVLFPPYNFMNYTNEHIKLSYEAFYPQTKTLIVKVLPTK